MIEPDIVLTYGETVTGGDVAIEAFETPGHSMGTTSFAFDARDGALTYCALTVCGLGLNRIRGPDQVEAFIASVKRIRTLTQDGARPAELHLSTDGFSAGLTEAIRRVSLRIRILWSTCRFPEATRRFTGRRREALVIERQRKAN